jgi:S-adenosylmethionine-diacylglycerol 3-amino-3-carboxypropyl transferase
MAVGSGGCTILSLLTLPFVSKVVAVDMNPAQLHLIRLKQALMLADLPLHDKLEFLGASYDSTNSEAKRMSLYRSVLRPALSPEAQAFWDGNLDHIAGGVNRVGRFEAMFRDLASTAALHGISPVSRPLEVGGCVCDWCWWCRHEGHADQATKAPQWKPVFDKVFARHDLVAAFGPDAVNYSMSQEFSDHFHDVFTGALRTYDPSRNYFLHSIWRDSYPTVGDGDLHTASYLTKQFRAVDTNGDGYIDASELRQACGEAGVTIDQQRADELIGMVASRDGRVSLDEFLQTMYR